MSTTIVTDRGFLNHTELVYRPGERALATQVFETLGCRVVDPDGPYLVILVDPKSDDFIDNVLYASEVTPQQWAFEQALQKSMEQDEELARTCGGYHEHTVSDPQSTTHFGLRLPSIEQFDATLERIENLKGDLAGRLNISGVFRHDDPGALDIRVSQAFIRTDVVAAGLVSLGQHIELQVRLDQ